MKKKRRRLFYLIIFTIVQFGGLFALDQFLKQPDFGATPVNAGVNDIDKPKLTPPADAMQHIISSDQSDMAYTTSEDELVIVDQNSKELFRENVGKVSYMNWLGKSNTLLYMVDKKSSQELFLLQSNTLASADSKATDTNGSEKENNVKTNKSKSISLKRWTGTERKIENIYFSPYVEYFNIHVKNGTRDELYKYKAGTGLYQLSIWLKIESIEYDDRKDIMTITSTKGDKYRFVNDRLVPLSQTENP